MHLNNKNLKFYLKKKLNFFSYANWPVDTQVNPYTEQVNQSAFVYQALGEFMWASEPAFAALVLRICPSSPS